MTESTTHTPKQPQKQPVKSSKKTTEPTPSQEIGSSKQQPPSTSSAPKPQTTLSDTPPPADNPLEEPNIWCEILKFEGHHHENKVAEGFQTWLKKQLIHHFLRYKEICIYFYSSTF